MCLVKTPKLQSDPNATRDRDPTIIRNPYLDGVGPTANANRTGRSSLRIMRGSGSIRPSAPPIASTQPGLPRVSTPPALPGVPPVRGGGGGGGRITPGMNTNVY